MSRATQAVLARRRAPTLLAVVLAVAASGPGAALGQPTGTLLGGVYDQARLVPLEGVTVLLAETGARATTDREGGFAFEGVREGRVTLKVTLEGWVSLVQTAEITALEVALIQFPLQRVAAVLDEILVLAGQPGRAQGAAQAEIVDREDGARTAADLLTRRVPGLAVTRGTGALGAGLRVRLRGSNSITASDQPAVYLDGVRIDDGGAIDIRVLDQIPAGDVLRIRVLRGPAASSLYPLSAAGVLLIETRRSAKPPS